MKTQSLPVWDLSRFYKSPHDPRIEKDMKQLKSRYLSLRKKYRGKVATLKAKEVEALFLDLEKIDDKAARLGSYASLLATTDTVNPEFSALEQKIKEWGTEVGQLQLFIGIEWNTLEEKKAQTIISGIQNKTLAHYLTHLRAYAPHTLKEDIEEVILEKNLSGASSFSNLFTKIISTLTYELDQKQLTQSQVLQLLKSSDRTKRKKAAAAVTKTLLTRRVELGHIYNTLIADKSLSDKRRGYKTWITKRNISNKVTDTVMQNLITEVVSNYDIVAKHYEFKKKLLGVSTLYDYDRYAPVTFNKKEKDVSWTQAKELVQNAYTAFDPQVGKIIAEFFSGNYIHAALLPNKRSGAFCASTVASAHPYILMNFTNKEEDVRTLAHELGHGLHQYLAGQTHGDYGLGMPLTTQELASTFGEMIVFDYQKKQKTDQTLRLSMLVEKIDEIIATVFRQVSMYRFEDMVHTKRRLEGELSYESLNDAWMKTQTEMFGESVVIRDEYASWWSYIPHFIHTPGYVYAYAFGELLSLSLYNKYLQNPKQFTPQYIQLLKAGDSDFPEVLLKDVGLDLKSTDIWKDGLDLIRNMVAEETHLYKAIKQ